MSESYAAVAPSGESVPTRREQEVKLRGAWRAEVLARVLELESRLAAVPAEVADTDAAGQPGLEADKAIRAALIMSVTDDRDAAVAAVNRKGPAAWWTGSAITEAWEAVHNAELTLLRIESDDAVLATVPRLLAWIHRTMDTGDLRTGHEEALTAAMAQDPATAVDRTKIRGALVDVIEANNRRYASVRTFRNNLIIITGLLVILLATLATWHAFNSDFISLCGKEEGGVLKECLGGKESGPHGTDVWLVLLTGALGGLLGIAFAFAEGEETATRYDPKIWQAFLKPVTGAATALVAVLLLQSKFLLEPTEASQATFLAYAVIFGFSQQLLTRFVDKRADSLISPDGS